METEGRAKLVEQYKAGEDAIRAAVAGITDAEMDTRPGPDEWTAREIIHHLADSEMRSAIRLRQLIAEDSPVIQGYDEGHYARALHYERPVGASLDAAVNARRANAELLSHLTAEEWDRSGTHQETGAYSVDDWLRIYASHAHDHAEQIRRARSSGG